MRQLILIKNIKMKKTKFAALTSFHFIITKDKNNKTKEIEFRTINVISNVLDKA